MILYTTKDPVLLKVHKCVCQTGFCTVKGNSQMELIFRISIKVCSEYKILRKFQEMVRRIKCNLAVYCLIVTARDRDRNMSPKTFRKFWASHRLIQFREGCHWCGESLKVLAGDGTKIRVSMQKISIVPTESASKDEVMQTLH